VIRRLSERLAAHRDHAAQRREHEVAMSIPSVATEHSTRVELDRARGLPSCRFCP
jgi:hypothetical protein